MLVDSGASRDNCSRVAAKAGWGVEIEDRAEGGFKLVIDPMIYLDYAATSWPKPPAVHRGDGRLSGARRGNPGRSGHDCRSPPDARYTQTREPLAELFNASDPQRIVLTANVTHALNIVLLGLCGPGDRVVTTGIEHNSVMRPLRRLET